MRQKVIAFFILSSFFMLMAPNSESMNERTVTFSKYLPDGRIETFNMSIKFYEGETMSGAITRKCKELLAEDENMHRYAEVRAGLYTIVSGGGGLHFSVPLSFRQSSNFSAILSLFRFLVYCNYNSGESLTDIFPVSPPNNATSITGPHKIFCLGFIGVMGWAGFFSFSTTGFAGFSPVVWTS